MKKPTQQIFHFSTRRSIDVRDIKEADVRWCQLVIMNSSYGTIVHPDYDIAKKLLKLHFPEELI